MFIGLAAVAVAAVSTKLDKKLLPDLREPHVLVRWDGAAGTVLPEMNRIGTRVSDELRGIPGVVNVGSHFGRAVTSDQAVGANAGTVSASISPDADYDRTVAAIQDVTAGYPGLDQRLITYSNQRVNDITTSDSAPVTVRVYGDDLAVLQHKADEIRAAISGVDGPESERVSSPSAEPTIQVEVDLAQARVHGVKPGRCASCRHDTPRRDPGGQHLRQQQGLRRGGLEPFGAAPEPDRRAQPAPSTPPPEDMCASARWLT